GDAGRQLFNVAGAEWSAKLGGETQMNAKFRRPTEDPIWLKALLGTLAIGFIAVLLLLPLVLVFKEALAHGLSAFWAAMVEPDSLAAVRLSLTAAAIAVP